MTSTPAENAYMAADRHQWHAREDAKRVREGVEVAAAQGDVIESACQRVQAYLDVTDEFLIDLYWKTTGDWAIPDSAMAEFGRAVVAAGGLFATRPEAQVKAEALREAADLIGNDTCCYECNGVADMMRTRAALFEADHGERA